MDLISLFVIGLLLFAAACVGFFYGGRFGYWEGRREERALWRDVDHVIKRRVASMTDADRVRWLAGDWGDVR